MIVTAWSNGKHYPSGAGYGLRLTIADRDLYFKRTWSNVLLELEGEGTSISVNTSKPSFWGPECRELISKDIGKWLIKNKKAPWTKSRPPKMLMEPIARNTFRVTFAYNQSHL